MEDVIYNYRAFNEKLYYFHSGDKIFWDDIDKLFSSLENDYLKGHNTFIYRGCSEGKYMMFNSAQREYIENKMYEGIETDQYFVHYDKYVTSLMSKVLVWNNRTVEKYFANSAIDNKNPFALLSFMQHHNIPTPLLDFTYNPFVALYFAISDHDGSVLNNVNNIMEDFVSIYSVFKPNIIHDYFHYSLTHKNIDLTDTSYSQIASTTRLFCLNDENKLRLLNNPNVINQQGTFYFNHHPFCPLEVAYTLYIKELIENPEINPLLKQNLDTKIGRCWNIHKSFIPKIRKRLEDMGITKSFIFPDFRKIKMELQ